MTIPGFVQPADAIVPCPACGAAEGVPCSRCPKDRAPLPRGFVHFGRRMKRLLLTARATFDERRRIESELVAMLVEDLAKKKPSNRARRSA